MGSSVGRSVGAALRAAFGNQTVGRDGLRGGLERIHSDGTVASGWMAPCFWKPLLDTASFVEGRGGRKRGGRDEGKREEGKEERARNIYSVRAVRASEVKTRIAKFRVVRGQVGQNQG